MEIEFESTVPLYEQISQQLQILIKEGGLSPGDQLPTTRQLAVKLGINFNTVARAYRLLDQEGLISTQPGRGTFVLDQTKQKSKTKRTAAQIEELTRFYIQKAARLGFKEEEIKGCFEKIVSETQE
jgi:GntR family transcriptional regulator